MKNYILIIVAAIYILSPIDLIPDSLLLIGIGDDLLVTILVFLKIYLKKKRDSQRLEEVELSESEKVLEGELLEE